MGSCDGCYWEEQCGSGERCEHYSSPATDEFRLNLEYEIALKERAEDYEDVLREIYGQKRRW